LTPARTPLASALRPAPADLVAAIPVGVGGVAARGGERRRPRGGDGIGDSLSRGADIASRSQDGRTLVSNRPRTKGCRSRKYRLAALYEKGTGVTRDVPLARAWYLKAAKPAGRNARAMHNLAVDGRRRRRDRQTRLCRGRPLVPPAGELGVRDSQFNLGVLYGPRVLGVPQDLEQFLAMVLVGFAARRRGRCGRSATKVAAKLDSKGVGGRDQGADGVQGEAPEPSANEARAPVGGWDARTDRAAIRAAIGAVRRRDGLAQRRVSRLTRGDSERKCAWTFRRRSHKEYASEGLMAPGIPLRLIGTSDLQRLHIPLRLLSRPSG